MRPYLLFLLACVCALAGALAAQGQTDPAPDPIERPTAASSPADEPDLTARALQREIDRYRLTAWRWQRVMGRPLKLRLSNPPKQLQDRIPIWKRVAARAKAQALHPPHEQAWRCIHHFEGAWNDPNGPYYGGLQMDLGFQRTYGRGLLQRKGTADHWTPLEQMWVAERAHRAGRGFYPWPNTARYCGLI